jgi:hypothetical protein
MEIDDFLLLQLPGNCGHSNDLEMLSRNEGNLGDQEGNQHGAYVQAIAPER